VDSRLLLAWLHLLALAVGVGGVWSRARALRHSLRDPEDQYALRRAYAGDLWWVVALGLWIITGLARLLGGTEKSFTWYFGNRDFALKMALVLAIVALEVWPRKILTPWRRKKAAPNPRDAGRIEAISYVQCALVVVTALAATGMARGYGTPTAVPVASTVSTSSTPVPVAPTTPPIPPSGTETVTADDLALLMSEIAMPLDGIEPATLHSNFAERRGGGSRQHDALDIMAPRRTPVKSAARGRVLKLFTSVDGGLMIYAADSSERFVLMYAHLDGYAPAMRDGAPLARGEVIGYVGSTGNALASAPHLHFAIARSADVRRWSRGKPIDPLPVLVAARSP
jgi:peptidoglycan LD-endopeptidase LytH